MSTSESFVFTDPRGKEWNVIIMVGIVGVLVGLFSDCSNTLDECEISDIWVSVQKRIEM